MKLSKREKAEYHSDLLSLKRSGPRVVRWGICDNAVIPYEVVGSLSEKWSKFSGYTDFPVPSGRQGISPHDAYASADDMWDKRTKYGRLRWELLDFLIEATKPEA